MTSIPPKLSHSLTPFPQSGNARNVSANSDEKAEKNISELAASLLSKELTNDLSMPNKEAYLVKVSNVMQLKKLDKDLHLAPSTFQLNLNAQEIAMIDFMFKE